MVGDKRTPVAVDQVKFYTSPPAKYAEIAIISVDAGHDFKSDQVVADEAVERIKQEAASLGANGIILSTVGEKGAGTSVGMGYGSTVVGGKMVTNNSTIVMMGQRYKTISGTAIFTWP